MWPMWPKYAEESFFTSRVLESLQESSISESSSSLSSLLGWPGTPLPNIFLVAKAHLALKTRKSFQNRIRPKPSATYDVFIECVSLFRWLWISWEKETTEKGLWMRDGLEQGGASLRGRGVEVGTAMSSYSGVPAFQHNHILSARPLQAPPKSEYHHHRIVGL